MVSRHVILLALPPICPTSVAGKYETTLSCSILMKNRSRNVLVRCSAFGTHPTSALPGMGAITEHSTGISSLVTTMYRRFMITNKLFSLILMVQCILNLPGRTPRRTFHELRPEIEERCLLYTPKIMGSFCNSFYFRCYRLLNPASHSASTIYPAVP
ncbi:hypothetical protein ASPBRDRAFT_284141 [Aspergillus brasiliensis CBS 101740]|uniref:Secreted protein n=1 Tax=Aspergillus brasiliensis (strain CBS 101740 / IMI 381727 / IBT 21946) TaxID=767769 RepID=A0A1L9UDA8_ASPBC|nr:hypothetical protein ASPBRDRAFT_284141 [Aspergillus brasiliensis CBS 101740]